MNSHQTRSATPAMGYGRRRWIAAVAVTLGGTAISATTVRGDDTDGVSKAAEAIHQEPVLQASPKRIYDALTDAQQFQRVTMLSVDAKGTDFATKPAVISREPGSAFSLFGGYVTGRQIELVPNQRLVQAWRAGSWPVGVYSIARFELVAEGASTKVVFDHTGFPQGDAEHLAAGWKSHYWEGLEKFLA
jgi:activator of HSP90 ATPase